MLPNFIGIGAQRAGTTWLYACLRQHPQVFVPPVKELHFFNAHYDRGLHWYERHFQPAHNQDYRAIGEITPSYLDHEQAIPRMAQLLPHAKLVVILREPVDRAYSAYKLFRSRYGRSSFYQACLTGRDLLRQGCYAQHLARAFEHYPRHQVKVFLYDELVTQPTRFLADLWQFLGVDPTFIPSASNQRFNSALYPRAAAFLSRCHLDWSIRLLKKTPLAPWIKQPTVQTTPEVAPDEFVHVRSYFRQEVLQLQTLLNRDLSSWLS